MSIDDSLAHYGVPGMKWGVRRRRGDSSSRVTPTNSNGTPVINGGSISSKRVSKIRAGEGSGALREANGKLLATPRGEQAPNPKRVGNVIEARGSMPVGKKTTVTIDDKGKESVTKIDPSLKIKKTSDRLTEDAAIYRALQDKAKKQGVDSLTNDELKIYNTRTELSKKYKTAVAEQNKKKDSRIKKIISETANKELAKLAGGVAAPITEKAISTITASPKYQQLQSRVAASIATRLT